MPFITSTQILASIFISYALGVWIGRYTPIPPIIPVIITIGYLICCRWLKPHDHRHILRVWLLVMLCGLGTLTVQAKLKNPIPPNAYGELVTFRGEITYDPKRDNMWYSSYAVGHLWLDDKRIASNVKVILNTKYNAGPYTYGYGTAVKAVGELKQPSEQRNPGGFNYRNYLIGRGVFGTIRRIEEIEELGTLPSSPPLLWAESVQRQIQRILGLSAHAKILRAMCLGERSALDADTIESFQKSGAAHVLAVSGLHISLIAGFCTLILLKILPNRIAYIITMFVVASYAFIIGPSASVLRATSMWLTFLGARAIDKKPDITDVILLIAFGLLLYNPLQLWDIGFQLSFSAVGGIIWFMPRWEEIAESLNKRTENWPKHACTAMKWFVAGLGVTIASNIGTTLITAYHFNQIPIAGIPVGPFIVGTASAIVTLTFLMVIAGLININLAEGFVPYIDTLISNEYPRKVITYIHENWNFLNPDWGLSFLELMNITSSLDWAVWKVKTPSVAFILVYVAAVLYLKYWAWWWVQHGKKMLYPAAGILVVWLTTICIGIYTKSSVLQVTFIDVGQGDSIFIRFPDGKNMLIDAGNWYKNQRTHKVWDNGEKTVAPYLTHIGEHNIDVVLLTHPDNDHLGGLPHIVEEFKIGYVLGASEEYMQYLPYRVLQVAIEAQGIPFTYDRARLNKLTDTAKIELLSTNVGGSKNNRSLSVKITYGNVKFLFTGDIERKAERALVESDSDLSAHFLQAPHHGSKTSSSNMLLDAVSPKFAIISCGVDNRYGHPHKSVLNRYEERGVKVLRTDKQGAITILTNGKRCWIKPHIKG